MSVKKTEKTSVNQKNWITSGFVILLGIFCVLLSMFLDFNIISQLTQNGILVILLTIVSKASSSVGISLIVGFTTSKIRAFEEKQKDEKNKTMLEEMLEDLIITKTFLQTLSEETKRNIIASLLTPENSTLNKHSNIKEYLDTKTDKYLKFFDINFRTNFIVDIKVYKDRKLNRFVAKYNITHRIYKINRKYEPICIWLDDPNSEIISTKIKHDNKVLATFAKDSYNLNDGFYQYKIPDEYLEHNFLVIEQEIVEYGQSHWISLFWKSMNPIEGIDYKVNCKNGIVKSHYIFDNNDVYDIPIISEDRRSIHISSSKWLDPYTGIGIIVAEKSTEDNLL